MTTTTDIPLNLDSLNVKDQFKGLTPTEIKMIAAADQTKLELVFLNVIGDFNKSTGIRNAAFFNAHKVFIVGSKRWDKRGAVGAWNYIDIKHLHQTFFLQRIKEHREQLNYRIVAVENNVDRPTIPLTDYTFQPKTMVIFGEEGAGIPNEVLDIVDDIIEIQGTGPMRSLNVGVASGIVTYEYTRQMSNENL